MNVSPGQFSVEQLRKLLQERKNYLTNVIRKSKKQLYRAPDGRLRGAKHGNKFQYFCRKSTADKNGTYIKTSERGLAVKLAQKEYDQLVLQAAGEEMRKIDALLAYYSGDRRTLVSEVYDKRPEWRRTLIKPVIEPWSAFVARWEAEEYSGKGFKEGDPEHYSAKGERMRSKSETLIADALARFGIPYHYEQPLLLWNMQTVYPDFKTVDPRTRKVKYWEHLGLLEDKDYLHGTLEKLYQYQLEGIMPGHELILSYETKGRPLNNRVIEKMIRTYYFD